MVARTKSKANPELLAWARKSAKLDVETAAEKVGVALDVLEAWESGEAAPSIPQLRKLGDAYKRPIVVFYLSAPPKDFDPLRDFRRLPLGAPEESPELAGEIRWAHEMREVALEAFASNDVEVKPWTLKAKPSEAPETVGRRVVKELGVTPDDRAEWKTWYDAYAGWRHSIEAHDVLCFQISHVDVEEARGFAICQHPLPVIAVNAADAPPARIFTLIHEFTHLMLGDAGKCDLHERGAGARNDVEVFCNAVAAEVLVPVATLRAESMLRAVHAPRKWANEEVKMLADKYRVSREVIYRRLVHLGLATADFYRQKRAELLAEERAETKAGGGNYYSNMRTKLGTPIIRSVLDAYNNGKLTANEAAGYLRVKVDHLFRLVPS